MKSARAATLATLLAALEAAHAQSVQVAANARHLADLTLEQLGSIEVTAVSGRAEPLKDAAASVFVITRQDIVRAGAVSLPEALRLAPTLQVAQTSAGQWAISARGFQDAISNKLLVMVDGRTIYSSLFAGVFWDANDVLLDDVERIEVVSGPGGTLWGANAVNGVINILTRSAADTQGGLLKAARSGRGGREAARWGTRLGDDTHVRFYALAVDRGNTQTAAGTALHDDAVRDQLGFRSDWAQGVSAFTLQGDAYHGGEQPSSNQAPALRGGNLLGRWSSQFADGSAYKVQAYYDLADRNDTTLFRNKATTQDVQFTHEAKVPVGQLLWGAGHRTTRDVNQPTALVLFSPGERSLSWTNLFAQYQGMVGSQLQPTIGLKLERNSYTGLELLPNLRLAWLHSMQATTWASLSRVVRAPSRIDRDFYFPGQPPFVIAGGPNFQGEKANVVEIGHRGQPSTALNYSVTVFRQNFQGLRAGVPGQVPNTVENLIDGPVDGIEAWAQWQVTSAWRLVAGYVGLHQRLRYVGGLSPSTTSFPGLGNDPSHQWSLRSSLNLGPRTDLDLMARRVGALPSPAVPAYTAVDASLAFQATPSLRLAVLGRNLFDPRHIEFGPPAIASQFGRLWMLQATWRLQ
ncbi:TonB-dependent receptor plug domain-containing protein [Ramlibacter sp. MMS24-I3-19]|uniref:TonB-dependent receptor plug domain-containing protein n=1 Tax=Ramlibacter sp. MMS24-I3-19 TaxID=3416606 RepID=UPI003D06197C